MHAISVNIRGPQGCGKGKLRRIIEIVARELGMEAQVNLEQTPWIGRVPNDRPTRHNAVGPGPNPVLTTIRALAVVTLTAPVFHNKIGAIKQFKARGSSRRTVLAARVSEASRMMPFGKLYIETSNTARVQTLNDVRTWLQGKPDGNGGVTPGLLTKLGIRYSDVVIRETNV